MGIVSGLTEVCAGLAHPKQQFQIQKYSSRTPINFNTIQRVSERIPRAKIGYGSAAGFHPGYVTYAQKSRHDLSYRDDYHEEPFWATMIKEALGSLTSLFIFLLEQPSQLKYIEWPSFRSTLKTASLTLGLVALLIVALASVDSALCYLLAVLLRKTP